MLNLGNKTVSSLIIHNKEVQSIITTDNVVLYEKESTPILSEPNSITISTSKYILSEHDTDTCVLTATVTDENNNPCNNQTVTFKANNTVLGTAITDNTGVATYTYNSQGNGEFYASANIGNLSSNSLLIEDCKYYKESISSTITPQVPISSYTVIEFDVIKKVNQSTNATATLQVGNNTDYLACGYGASANTIMYFFERTSSVSILQQNSSPYLTLNKNYHVKLIINGTTAIMLIGDKQYVIKDIGVSLDKLNKIDYNSNALISNIKVNDIKVSDSISLSASKTILSDYDDSNAFTDWTGTYTTGTDKYYYLTPTSTTTFNKTLPSSFELRYKFKTKTTGTSGTGLLWSIGTDANNCVLIGHEASDRRIRLYTRSNGSNTSRYTQNYSFNFQEWTDTIIRYEDNIISITVNNNTLSYELSDASLLKSYDTYNQLEIADIIITDLETGTVVSDSSNSSVISASVLDSNDNPVVNGVVVFDDELSEEILVTDNSGVCQFEYVSQGIGDVLINANTGNVNDSLLLEDCQYYNDGSSINGLDVKSGVSCSSDGEWITITTSTSGEKFVYPPVCYTGSDDWEVSFKCSTSNFNNQAFGLQMENCGTTTYSGDSQYTAYTGSQFGNCMGAGNKTYSLSDNDLITFKRLGGYWRLYVNNNTEIFNRQYNWTNSRVPGFYTNKSRIQRLKELKYKWLRSYSLTINAPTSMLVNTEQIISGVLSDNKGNYIINKNVSLLVNGIVVDTQKTNNEGIVSFEYIPSSVGSQNIQLIHTNDNSNYDCESLIYNITVTSDKLILNTDKNIISYNHNETCVLTATYDDGSGATINLYNNDTDTLLGVMTDNNDGTYSYTYNATGYGDITIRAECDNEYATTSISDCLLYDDGSIDKSSSYGIYVTNSGGYATFIHDNTNKWYDFTVDTVKDRFKIMQFGDFTDNDLLYELDILIANKTTPFNCIANIRDVNNASDGNSNGLQLGTWTSQRFVRFMKNNNNMGTDSPSGALSTGVNYRLIASMDNTNSTLTATIFNKDTDSVLLTKTWNDTVSTNDKWYATFGQFGYNSATTTRIKRIMVKKI